MAASFIKRIWNRIRGRTDDGRIPYLVSYFQGDSFGCVELGLKRPWHSMSHMQAMKVMADTFNVDEIVIISVSRVKPYRGDPLDTSTSNEDDAVAYEAGNVYPFPKRPYPKPNPAAE